MEGAKLIFLVGFMGSGKSTWGKKIARRLQADFIDLDQAIVEECGLSISEFFEQNGESAFRAMESDVLRRLPLTGPGAYTTTVIATGGGTPCYHENMRWMNEVGSTIYFRLSDRALWQRLRQADPRKRPLIKDFDDSALLNFIKEKLKEREPYYLQSSHVVDQLRTSPGRLIEQCGLLSI